MLGLYFESPNARKISKITITESDKYKHWQESLTKQQYELYENCVKNYAQNPDYRKFICPITQYIPLVPVEAPNGCVYEKKAIEAHLEHKWQAVEEFGQSMGMDEAKLQEIVEKWDDEEFKKSASPNEQRLRERMLTICPMRSKPFKKDDLKYASKFAKDAIIYLKNLKERIKVQQDQDPILRAGCQAILDKYVADYGRIRDRKHLRLTIELRDYGATEEMIRTMTDELEKLEELDVL